MGRTLLMLAILSAALLPAGSGRAETTMATAPIDYTLYREGEVRRIERYFDGWLLTCDQIARLNRKFCSMRAVARSTDGTVVAAMTISTDDMGRPAAIVTVPFGMLLGKGVGLSQSLADGRRQSLAVLHPAQCGGLGCQAVWAMKPEAIRQLRAGASFQLRFWMKEAPMTGPWFPSHASKKKPIMGSVAAAGFSDALKASLP